MAHDDSITPDGSVTPDDQPGGFQLLRMRGPADMAAMLPYLLGFYPDDSMVAVGLYGPQLQQCGAIRLDIPEDPQLWSAVATDFARLLVDLSEQRSYRPDAVLVYLCRDPEPDSPAAVTTLRPLADHLLRAFRELDVPVKESLCVSGGRWWSFLCADPVCCPPDGAAVYSSQEPLPVVAAATYAGLAPRGSRRAIAAALAPIGPPEAEAQRDALARHTAMACERLMVEPAGSERVVAATAELLEQAMAQCRSGAPRLDPWRSARLIVGLLDKHARDRAAEYAEPEELAAAQRLWRYLAQRCVAPYTEYAKVPLTLLAWTAWLARDTATARVALGMALALDPEYTLAILLYESLNTSLAPEGLLGIVRGERAKRADERDSGDESEPPSGSPAARPDADPGGRPPGGAEEVPRQRQAPPIGGDGRGQGPVRTPGSSGQSSVTLRKFEGPSATGSGCSSPLPPADAARDEAEAGEAGSGQSLMPPGTVPKQRRGGSAPPSPSAASAQPVGGPPPVAGQPRSGRAAGRVRRRALARRTIRRVPRGFLGGRNWNRGA
jgi:hypothetical protein